MARRIPLTIHLPPTLVRHIRRAVKSSGFEHESAVIERAIRDSMPIRSRNELELAALQGLASGKPTPVNVAFWNRLDRLAAGASTIQRRKCA